MPAARVVVHRARPDAVPLDPIHLPLDARELRTVRLSGMFGALRDASPDAWGRRVIERVLGRADLDEVDYLLESPGDRAGALSFGLAPEPPAPMRDYNRVVQLAELVEAAARIEQGAVGDPVPPLLHDLVSPGTSLGGARPKNVVEDGDGLCVAKFPQRCDRWNHAAVEAAMLALAGRCGIRVPVTRIETVGDARVLLVRRFDRERVDGGYHRHRMASALTVLGADESPMDRREWSYLLLADELGRWSGAPREDRVELFRRMAFNALISNGDDHPRNHALIAPLREWRLSPAYDLTPQPAPSQERRDLAMLCGEEGRIARRRNLRSAAPRFGLTREDADALIDEMEAVVAAGWRDEVVRHGGTAADVAAIQGAFVYPGFEWTQPLSP